jgi:SAM-dependent methyltransferase
MFPMNVCDCKICGHGTRPFGEKRGSLIQTTFEFRQCEFCRFVFIVNPCLDFTLLYNSDYYAGKGADPLVDYHYELAQPDQTIRQYEWRGIEASVRRIFGNLTQVRWLDFGCGNGGLVRHLRTRSIDAVGYEEGAIVGLARSKGIPILTESELDAEIGLFSIVTMIEVIEHLPDPISVLKNVRRLLQPGGLLFLTTGNSAPHIKSFLKWGYVIPDIHVSYFNPQNMALAMTAAGFSCDYPGYVDGWNDIIRFKCLKTVGWRKTGFFEQLVPWAIASRIIDARYKNSAHPVGRAA